MQKHAKHGLYNHRLYQTWHSMVKRCNNKLHPTYKNYGLRGIEVCERWMILQNFINDMYPSFQEGYTLDRIDNNGNYEPSNCRWVDRSTQNRNTRKLISKNTSGYRGVSWHKSGKKWRSQIRVNGILIDLGSFKNIIDAAQAYDNYVKCHKLEHTINFS